MALGLQRSNLPAKRVISLLLNLVAFLKAVSRVDVYFVVTCNVICLYAVYFLEFAHFNQLDMKDEIAYYQLSLLHKTSLFYLPSWRRRVLAHLGRVDVLVVGQRGELGSSVHLDLNSSS